MAGVIPRLELIQDGDAVKIKGTNMSATFSRVMGMLTSLNFSGHEILATNKLSGPNLQLYRAPTDNDKGFGKWLARDWRDAGLTNLIRHMDSFDVSEEASSAEFKITTVSTSTVTNGSYHLTTIWTIHGDGTVDMDNIFTPSGSLPLLPRIGVVMQLAKDFKSVCWYGRGPWENYPDRKDGADMGVWRSTVDEQYVPYIRPQENANKEDLRWLTLADKNGNGLKISAKGDPFSFSALHYTASDLASVRHNYELTARPEIILSLDARECGLGNSSCGPGVLDCYAVPPRGYFLKLRFSGIGLDHN